MFLRGFRAAFFRTKLWICTWLFLLLLSLVPAFQTAAFFKGAVGSRYPSAELARDLHSSMGAPSTGLGAVFRQDHADGLAQLNSSVASGGAVLALIALLFGVFAAGGWLQVTFEQPERQTLRRFGFGGARYFGRMLRVALMTLAALALVHWLLYGDPWKRLVLGWIMDVPASDWGKLETLESEQTVVQLRWLQDGLAAIGFMKVMAWVIYTRTRLVLRDSRSVLVAACATWWTMVKHPVQTMRPLALLLLLEAIFVVAVLGWWHGRLEAGFEGRSDLLASRGHRRRGPARHHLASDHARCLLPLRGSRQPGAHRAQ